MSNQEGVQSDGGFVGTVFPHTIPNGCGIRYRTKVHVGTEVDSTG
ncbi:MAG: hypothetical protein OXG25_07375 [Gammaproteobacteria bacterium]|nr:hypothetical protein [Gammaproteobacteria bacterium]